MKLRALFVSIVFSLLLSSCATTANNVADLTCSNVDKAIASADTARMAAAKVGYEWRDTAKMIKKAKALAKQGKNKEAMTLAQQAKDQADAAVAQYHSESIRFAKNH